MTLISTVFETPVGPMRALASDRALCALEFSLPNRLSRLDTRLARWFGGPPIETGTNAITESTREWLDAYFAGRAADTSGLALDARGAAFEMRVWRALRDIPPGTTKSYGEIAREVGSPGAARAVGLANGANPIAIIVPCHRVIGSNRTLTGYGGGLDRKAWLLAHEERWRPQDSGRLF